MMPLHKLIRQYENMRNNNLYTDYIANVAIEKEIMCKWENYEISCLFCETKKMENFIFTHNFREIILHTIFRVFHAFSRNEISQDFVYKHEISRKMIHERFKSL